MTTKVNTLLQNLLTDPKDNKPYKAIVHGMDRYGVLDVELPDCGMAARYIQAHRIERRVTFRQGDQAGNGNIVWSRPVVLSIDLK